MARRTSKKKTPPEKRPVGRPTKFTQELVAEIMECAKLGLTDKEICDITNIGGRTLTEWKAKNPAFYARLKRNKYLADRNVEQSLYMAACGHTKEVNGEENYYPPNPTSMIFWLKNRQPEKWRDKVQVEQESKITLALDTGEETEEFSV